MFPPRATGHVTPLLMFVTVSGVGFAVVVPELVGLPSCPYWFDPQHFNAPVLRRAQECFPPAAIEVTPEARLVIADGAGFATVFAVLPSWARSFDPQHHTPPDLIAQVCAPPPTTPVTFAVNPLTCTGAGLAVVVPELVGLPSWPFWFDPQHVTAPAVVRAHECKSPAATTATPLPKPVTGTGAGLAVVDPAFAAAPSWPYWFDPQHHAPPDLRAQVWFAPAMIAVTPEDMPVTGAGVVVGVVVPEFAVEPSWPYWLLPQQYTAPAVVSPHVCPAPAVTRVHAGDVVPPVYVYLSAATTGEVPDAEVTRTSTIPAAAVAGATAVSFVADTTANEDAGTVPNFTPVTE